MGCEMNSIKEKKRKYLYQMVKCTACGKIEINILAVTNHKYKAFPWQNNKYSKCNQNHYIFSTY